jgi:peptidoglycan/LPS O-acetylase OafA/YrhL
LGFIFSTSAPTFARFPMFRLQRITTTGMYFPEIDGLRFIAIAWVVLLHLQFRFVPDLADAQMAYGHPLGMMINWGNMGVELFFAVSGFILGLPFAKQHLAGGKAVTLKAYYTRRITRLEPPYVIVVLLCAALYWLRSRPPTGEWLGHLGASLFYVHNFIYNGGSLFNSVLWSLEIEAQFYLIAPLLALLFAVRPAWLRQGLMLTGILLFPLAGRALSRHFSFDVQGILFTHLPFFLVGFWLADLKCRAPLLRPRIADAAGLLALLALPLTYTSTAQWLAFPATVFAFYYCVLHGDWLRRVMGWRPVALIGGMCYTIYLLHLPVMSGAYTLTRRWVTPDSYLQTLCVQAALVLPLLLAVSVVFYVLVERPCMDREWPSRLRGWLRGQTPPVTPPEPLP